MLFEFTESVESPELEFTEMPQDMEWFNDPLFISSMSSMDAPCGSMADDAFIGNTIVGVGVLEYDGARDSFLNGGGESV